MWRSTTNRDTIETTANASWPRIPSCTPGNGLLSVATNWCVCVRVCVCSTFFTGHRWWLMWVIHTRPGLARHSIIDLYTRVLINVAHSSWSLLPLPLPLSPFPSSLSRSLSSCFVAVCHHHHYRYEPIDFVMQTKLIHILAKPKPQTHPSPSPLSSILLNTPGIPWHLQIICGSHRTICFVFALNLNFIEIYALAYVALALLCSLSRSLPLPLFIP